MEGLGFPGCVVETKLNENIFPCSSKVLFYYFFTGARVSNTIRKGIISPDLYPNGTEETFMAGNAAALSGNKKRILHEWSFHMKFIKRAFGEFKKFYM